MGATPTHALPYPDGTAPTNVPYDLEQLATKTEATFAKFGRAYVAGPFTLTTDAAGYVTVTHGAPFTPRLVECHIVKLGLSLAQVIGCEIVSPTQAQCRFGVWNGTTTLNSTNVGANAVMLVCWE